MSKKITPRGQKPGKLQSKRRYNLHKRKAVMAIALVLILSLAGALLAQWRAAHVATRTNALLAPPPPQPSLSPSSPSKEYIYAGGRLIATEEPTSTITNGPAPTGLVATATSGTTVSLTWTAPTGSISSYQVERSQSISGPFTTLSPNPTTTSFTDTTASAGVAYLYQVKAIYTGSSGSSSYSNKDLATTIIFTDDPLTANVTPIKAVHLDELRQAVNAVRTTAGLGSSTWTDTTLLGLFAKAVHVQELRTSLDQALTALSITTSPYTDTSLPGVFIKKAHIEELRARVK